MFCRIKLGIVLSTLCSVSLFSEDVQEKTYMKLLEESPLNLQTVIEEGILSLHPKQMPSFAPLAGGISSSDLFLFSIDEQKYVLRILEPKKLDDPNPTLNKRMREVISHKAASSLGIAPEILYSDPNALIIIMQFIKSHRLQKKYLEDEDFIKHLGKTIEKVHSLNTPLPEKRTEVDRVKKYYLRATKKGIVFPSNFTKLYEEFLELEKYFQGKDVLCHGDLNSGNILVKGHKCFLIDWANSSYGHPLSDLGFFTLLSNLSTEQRSIFLESYFGRKVTSQENLLIKLAEARTCFVTATCWLDSSETKKEISMSKEGRIKHLDELLDSDSLKIGSEYIKEHIVIDPSNSPSEDIRLFALGYLKEYMIRISQLRKDLKHLIIQHP